MDDWKSLAASILPAIVGGMTGAQRGGIGAIPGALHGAGQGAQYSIANDLRQAENVRQEKELLLRNRQIEQQAARDQQRVALEQQRVGLEERRIRGDETQEARLQRSAELAAQQSELEMRKLRFNLNKAETDEKFFEKMRGWMTDDERLLFEKDPKSWVEKKEEDARLKGAGRVIESFVTGVKKGDGDTIAKALGSKGVGDLLEASIRARSTPRKAFNFVASADAGGGFLVNEQTGEVKFQTFPNMKNTDKRDLIEAGKIYDDARQTVEAQFKGPMGQIDMSTLGKTPEERDQKFTALITNKARELAAARGVPNLFNKDPEQSLSNMVSSGQIKNASEALSYLLSLRVPQEQAEAIVRKNLQAPTPGKGSKATSEY